VEVTGRYESSINGADGRSLISRRVRVARVDRVFIMPLKRSGFSRDEARLTSPDWRTISIECTVWWNKPCLKLEDSIEVVLKDSPTVVCGNRDTKPGTRLYLSVVVTSCSNVTFGSAKQVPRAGSNLIMEANGDGLPDADGGSVPSALGNFRKESELAELMLPMLLKGTCCSYLARNERDSWWTAN
jgi:hypothetical protein